MASNRGSNACQSHSSPPNRTWCRDGDGRIVSTRSCAEATLEVVMWEQVKQALVQSTLHFLTRFASMLPGLVALVLAVLVSIVIALILAFIVERLLIRMRFGERLIQWGISSPAKSSTQTPPLVVSRVIAGVVMLAGFLIGITAFDADWTSQLARTALGYIPNILAAGLVFMVGVIVAHYLGRSVLIGAVNMNLQYAR